MRYSARESGVSSIFITVSSRLLDTMLRVTAAAEVTKLLLPGYFVGLKNCTTGERSLLRTVLQLGLLLQL